MDKSNDKSLESVIKKKLSESKIEREILEKFLNFLKKEENKINQKLK